MKDNDTFDSKILIYAFGTRNEEKKEIAQNILAKRNKISLQALNVSIIENAIQIIMNHIKYSFWDGMMLAAAIEANCKIIYSEDMQPKHVVSGILITVNPFLK
jgi:predicted nucleic acid-binding protein